MRIELLYFDGCPTHNEALRILRDCVKELAIDQEVDVLKMESEQQARAERFLGSPTIRIDGTDIDPEARGRDDYGLKCRIYKNQGKLGGIPPREMILKALREAANA